MLTLLAAAAVAAAPAPDPRVARLSATQMLALGGDLQRAGKDEQALALYEGLDADRSPQVRIEALARRARIEEKRGRPAVAATLMRAIVDLAPDRGEPRLALARLLDRVGDIDGARRQLRAAQAGHLSPDLSRLADRYASALRARAPYGWSVEFALAPDSNINRATASDTLRTVIGDFDINRDSKSRSGVGVGTRASGFVRLPLSPSASVQVRADASQDRYRDDRFNRTTLALSAGPELTLGRTRLAVEGSVGTSAFGGATFQRWAQVSARGYRPLGPKTALALNLAGAKVDNLVNDLQDGRSLSGSLGLERALSATAGVQLNLSASRFVAADPGYSTRAVEAGLGGWLDLGPVTVSASAAKGRLAADARLALFPETRRDSSTRLGLGVTARNLRILTFSPVVRYTIERNASTVEISDYRRRRLELGVQRAF